MRSDLRATKNKATKKIRKPLLESAKKPRKNGRRFAAKNKRRIEKGNGRNMKKCVFAGTFDPPTLGHRAVAERAAKIFDEVIAAIMINPDKQPLFTAEERTELLKKTLQGTGAKVIVFTGTAADLMRETGADCYVRGVRNATDFDYETANYYASEKLCGYFPVTYVPCPQDLLHVSSSAVRALLRFGKSIDGYVAAEAKESTIAYYAAKK